MNSQPLILRNADSVSVEIGLDYAAVKNAAIEASNTVQAVTDAFTQELAVEALTALATIEKQVEQCRQVVKSPILDIGKKIDTAAKTFLADVQAESARLKKLISDFQAEERRKAMEAERARKAEEDRIAAEKRRAEEESRKAAEDAFLASSQAEANKAEIQRIEAEKRALALQQKEQSVQRAVAPAPARTAGLRVGDVWKFEVTDLKELFKARPDLCELKEKPSSINAALRAGLRECPGLRIYSEIQATISTRSK